MNRAEGRYSFLLLIGTLFGVGYLPRAPGTWGSLLFLPFIYFSYELFGFIGVISLTIIAFILSLISAPAAIKRLGEDPGEFVMDECAGQALVFAITLSLISITPGIAIYLLGFLLFRLFDIIKPFGIKRVEKFRGKFGILVDDLLAGLYASISLMALIYIFSRFSTT
ncbi:phosphatidylglycerophosphatase A [soil metagenome]